MSSKSYICERCGSPAVVCHHRIWLNSENVHDPQVALSFDNLEALCAKCHSKEHAGKSYYRRNINKNGTRFDSDGNLVKDTIVFIVCGAPGSGKSTYVREHKHEGDLVFDLDMICSALIGEPETYYFDHMPILDLAMRFREETLEHIEKRFGYWGKAWFITSDPDRSYWQYLAKRLNGEIIEMNVTEEECYRRIDADDRRKNKRSFKEAVKRWYSFSVVSCENEV